MLKVSRLVRHWFATPFSLKRAFPPEVLSRMQTAIAAGEAAHSGEIRVAIEASLPWSYLRRDAPTRQRAAMVFSKLRVWDTEHNNGVLIYLELADRAVEIVADRGLAAVPNASWEAICKAMREKFAAGQFEAGLIEGIASVGAAIGREFPLASGVQRVNEQSDSPTLL